MKKEAEIEWIEQLRRELSETIENSRSLTEPKVIERSMLLDEALNRYHDLIRDDMPQVSCK